MNFLSLFVRNLRHGPYTDPFPFGPAFTPKRFRGRVSIDIKNCEGCRVCEKVCPSGAIRFERTAEGLTFDLWHGTCVFCGACGFYCPTSCIGQTDDWHLSHPQAEKFAIAEHALIPFQSCTACGAKGLDTRPAAPKNQPPLSPEELQELRGRCPKCRAKYLKERSARV